MEPVIKKFILLVCRMMFEVFLMLLPLILFALDMDRWEENNKKKLSLCDEKLKQKLTDKRAKELFSAPNLYLLLLVYYPTVAVLMFLCRYKDCISMALPTIMRRLHPFRVASVLFLCFAYAAISVQAVSELRDHLHVDVLHNKMNFAIFLFVVIFACPLAIILLYTLSMAIYVATVLSPFLGFFSSVIWGLVNEYMYQTLPSLTIATAFAFSFRQTALLFYYAYIIPLANSANIVSYQQRLVPMKITVIQFICFTYRDLVNHHRHLMAGVLFVPVIFGIFALFCDVERVREWYNSGSNIDDRESEAAAAAAATQSPNDHSANDVGVVV